MMCCQCCIHLTSTIGTLRNKLVCVSHAMDAIKADLTVLQPPQYYATVVAVVVQIGGYSDVVAIIIKKLLTFYI